MAIDSFFLNPQQTARFFSGGETLNQDSVRLREIHGGTGADPCPFFVLLASRTRHERPSRLQSDANTLWEGAPV